MKFKWKTISLTLVFLTLMTSAVLASSSNNEAIAQGDKFFKIRGRGHFNDRAVPGTITNAINKYMEAYNGGNDSQELIIKIMHASYFYVTYATEEKAVQKEFITKAIEIGDAGLEKYPESAGINYWLSALWGRWSKVYGRIASSRKDVAVKIKKIAERTIELDPSYCEGGGYRTLGRLHFKTPRIPFLLSWPRKKKALKYLNKALVEGPENLTNHLFYAEALIERGRRDEARKEIVFIDNVKPHDEKIVEELRVKLRAREVMTILNDKILPLEEQRKMNRRPGRAK